MSTQYIVEIDLRTKGDFSAALLNRGLGSVSDKLISNRRHAQGLSDTLIKSQRSALDFGDALVSGLGKAATVSAQLLGGLARLGGHAAMGGIVAGVAATTYGVVSLNRELESTKISLGSIYQAQGIRSDLAGGIDLATRNIAEMRRQAAKLPGEFDDLRNIMTTTAIPAFHAGVSEKEHLGLSAKLMAAGTVAQMPLDQVAREAAQLIEGRSGSQNVLGMRLMGLHGDSAAAFNKMGAAERMDRMNAELDKYSGSIDAFSKSFDGLSSTALDNAKEWLRASTEPLFGRVKDALSDANGWLSENDALVKNWSRYVGDNLADAFDSTLVAAKEIGPMLADGLQSGMTLLKEYGPTLLSAGKGFAYVMSEIGADAVETAHALEKAYQLVADSALFKSKSVYDDERFSGLTDPQKSTLVRQRAAARENWFQDVPGVDTGSSGARWHGSTVTIGHDSSRMDKLMTGIEGILWLPSVAEAFEGYLRESSIEKQQRQMLGTNNMLRGYADPFDRAAASFDPMRTSYDERQTADDRRTALDQMTVALDDARSGIAKENQERIESTSAIGRWWSELTGSSDNLGTALNDTALRAYEAGYALSSMVALGESIKSVQIGDDALAGGTLAVTQMANDFLRGQGDFANKKKEPTAPKGGTHIAKVEIVVTSNSEPTRVARLVKDELVKVGQQRSKHAPRYDQSH